jgi:hypothetical protein
MTITEVQLPARQSKAALTEEQLKQAVALLRKGKVAGTDKTYKSRPSAQSAAHKLRHEIAARSDVKAETLRGVSYQADGEEAWRVAVAPKK